MSSIATISAVAAVAGGAISANGAKSAAAKAADANAKATSDTNALNLKMFNQSRGAADDSGYGHAVLGNYFGSGEQTAANTAFNNYQSLNAGATQVGNNLFAYQSSLNPSIAASMAALNNRYNGVDLSQRLGYAQPIWDARMGQAQTQGSGLLNVAQTQQSGINLGLMQALAQQNAQRNAQGYLGGSTFDRNRMLASSIGAQQQAAGALAQARAQGGNLMAAANLQNAQERGNFQLSDLDYRSNIGQLSGAMGSLASYQASPYTTMANLYTSAQQPLSFFRIGQSTYNQPFSPQVSPGIDSSQIWGSALSSAGKLGMDYFNSKQPVTTTNYPGTGYTPPSFNSTITPMDTSLGGGTGGFTTFGGGNVPASSGLDLSLFGGSGSTFGGGCHIARAVYGVENPKWRQFRSWLFTSAPVSLLVAYLNHADQLAPLLTTAQKADLRLSMDAVLRITTA